VRCVDNGSEKAAIGRRITDVDSPTRPAEDQPSRTRSGPAPKTLFNWAKGETAPSYDDARRLARVLHSSAAYILTGEEELEQPERGQMDRIERRLDHIETEMRRLDGIETEQRQLARMLQSQRQAVDAVMAQTLSAIAELVRRVEDAGPDPGTPPQSS
jgi:transcriptional regulator with XRE-family HTH domain